MIDLIKKSVKNIQNQFDSRSEDSNESNKNLFSNFVQSVPNLPVNVPPVLTIGPKRVRITEFIDEGGFSYVFKAKEVDGSEEEFALKRLLIQSSEQMQLVEKELSIMKKINGHKNIIGLIGSKRTGEGNDNNALYLLMELGECTVLDLMNQYMKSSGRFPEKLILRIFLDCSLGILHLHSMSPPIIHRDIKVENLLKVRDTFKLCDFGSCTSNTYDLKNKRQRSNAEDDINKNTTLEYRSPEMVDLYSGHIINYMSDMWALGCLLFKLMFFRGCFDDASSLQIIVGKYKIPKSPKYSSGLYELLKGLLNVDPTKRMDIHDVVVFTCKLLNLDMKIPPKPIHFKDLKGNKKKGRRNHGGDNSNEIVMEKKRNKNKNKNKNKKKKKKKKKKEVEEEKWEDNFDTNFEVFEKNGKGNESKSNNNNKVKESDTDEESDTDTDTDDDDDDNDDDDDDDNELFSQLDWTDKNDDSSAPPSSKQSKRKGKSEKGSKSKKKLIKPPSPRGNKRGNNNPLLNIIPNEKKSKERNEGFDWGDEEALFSGLNTPTQSRDKGELLKVIEPKRKNKSSNDIQNLIRFSENKKKEKKKPELKGNSLNDFLNFANDLNNSKSIKEKKNGLGRKKTSTKFTVAPQLPKVNSFDNFQVPKFYVGNQHYTNPPRANFNPVHTQQYYVNQRNPGFLMNPQYGHQNSSTSMMRKKKLGFNIVEEKKKDTNDDGFNFFEGLGDNKRKSEDNKGIKKKKEEDKREEMKVEDFFNF